MALELQINPDGTKEVIDRVTVETLTRKTRRELREIIATANAGIDANRAAKEAAQAALQTYKALFDEAEGVEAP